MNSRIKNKILEIRNLSIAFREYETGFRQVELPVISDLNVTVREGEIAAVVGSSGSGKSLLAHAVMGILPAHVMQQGEIYFEQELLTKERLAAALGSKIALVPQGVNYLDPLMKIGRQVRGGKKTKEAKKRQRDLFHRLGMDRKSEELYPFACSGGMSRRVFLAMAMMENPRLLIADEPTPGLELPLAKKAMEDFRSYADKGNGVLLITHDMELALETADRIAVFYAGTTVEEAPAADFASEGTLRHPYTRALWRAMPRNGFQALEGVQPYVKNRPKGCVFGPRCPYFSVDCQGEIPIRSVRGGMVRCIRPETGEGENDAGGF